MASTRTVTFDAQKVPAGDLRLILKSHFSTGSGSSGYTSDGRIMSMSPFIYKMPEDVTVFRIENITFKFSDLDDYFDTSVFNDGSSDATSVEAEIKLNGNTIFLGYVDLQSKKRDENKRITSFIVRGRLAELEDKTIDTDLKNEIDGDPNATAIYDSITYFNLKICIQKIFGFLGYVTDKMNWAVSLRFFDVGANEYSFDEIWVEYDDFFGSPPAHDLQNCYQLLKSFCLSMFCIAGIIDDEVYFWETTHTETAPTIYLIEKKEKKYWDKKIDGVSVTNKIDDYTRTMGDPNGKIVARFDIHVNTYGGSSNTWGDDGVNDGKITSCTHSLGSPAQYLVWQLCLINWAIFGEYRKEIEGEHYGVDLQLFQEPTIDSTDYQFSEVEIDYVKNKTRFMGRCLS